MSSMAVSVPVETVRQEPRLITSLTRHSDLNDTIQEYDRTADRYDEVRMKRGDASVAYDLCHQHGNARWFNILVQYMNNAWGSGQ